MKALTFLLLLLSVPLFAQDSTNPPWQEPTCAKFNYSTSISKGATDYQEHVSLPPPQTSNHTTNFTLTGYCEYSGANKSGWDGSGNCFTTVTTSVTPFLSETGKRTTSNYRDVEYGAIEGSAQGPGNGGASYTANAQGAGAVWSCAVLGRPHSGRDAASAAGAWTIRCQRQLV